MFLKIRMSKKGSWLVRRKDDGGPSSGPTSPPNETVESPQLSSPQRKTISRNSKSMTMTLNPIAGVIDLLYRFVLLMMYLFSFEAFSLFCFREV